MTFAEEKRGFTEEEAASLHKLLDTLSLYCAESTVWWDQGKGVKLDKNKKEKKEAPKRETVEAPLLRQSILASLR